ncbi:unnamed protein product [Penicillium viridicatum]
MATRTVYLISARNTSFQRAHFSIFVPSATNPYRGTKIHAVGAPMAGYVLEFKRNYNPSLDPHDQTFPIGQVRSSDIVDSPDAAPSIDSTPRGKIELAATQIPTRGSIRTSWHLSMIPPTSGVKNGLWNIYAIWLPKA